MSNWFILCIALNLQLVLVHSRDARALEKYYVLGTLLLNLATTLPPRKRPPPPPPPASPLTAAVIERQFGWDPLLGVCGLRARAPRDRLVWQLTTQFFWTLLTVTATVVCALTTTVYLYRQKVRPPPSLLRIRDTRSPCSSRSALALALSRARIAPRRRASRTYRCSTATARRSGSSTAAQPRSRAIVSRSTAHSGTLCCASVRRSSSSLC